MGPVQPGRRCGCRGCRLLTGGCDCVSLWWGRFPLSWVRPGQLLSPALVTAKVIGTARDVSEASSLGESEKTSCLGCWDRDPGRQQQQPSEAHNRPAAETPRPLANLTQCNQHCLIRVLGEELHENPIISDNSASQLLSLGCAKPGEV